MYRECDFTYKKYTSELKNKLNKSILKFMYLFLISFVLAKHRA